MRMFSNLWDLKEVLLLSSVFCLFPSHETSENKIYNASETCVIGTKKVEIFFKNMFLGEY